MSILVVAPPSPNSTRLTVANSPVSSIARTGMVMPNSQIRLVSPSRTNQLIVPPLVNTPVVVPPRTIVASGITKPPLIRLNPASAPTILGRTPLSTTPLFVTPTMVTPTVVTPRALSAPIILGAPSSVLSRPVVVTPRTTIVTPPVFSSSINRSVPIVITPSTKVIAPSSLSRLPSLTTRITPLAGSQKVITPGALANIPGFSTAPSVRTPFVSQVVTPSVSQVRTPLVSRVVTPFVSPVVTPLVSPVVTIKKENTIEENLAEKGFTVTDTIFVDVGGRLVPQYVKILNDFGQKAFVELDQEGDVVYGDGNQTMIVSKNATMVPASKQISAFEMTTRVGASGVAYECDGDICTLVQSIDTPSQPTRLVLTTASKAPRKTATVSGSATGYPIVQYSEVMTNPLGVAGIIEAATTNIRNAGYQECVKNWNDYKMAASDMNVAAGEFSNVSNMIINRLASDLRVLNGFRADYVRNPPKTEAGKIKYQSVIYNINNRQELLIALFAVCQVVPVSTEVIKEQNDNLKQSIKNLQDLFQNLGTVVQKSGVSSVAQPI
uniref:Uncharacterized protein n=1 Tax=Pithovirus LCPAC202 TaxID=2506592 RepID=A0A481Z6U9_9VIRU|nr:MAG: uncharacterized protein LCPAC202_01060 [Pithovirus LCPAC202]